MRGSPRSGKSGQHMGKTHIGRQAVNAYRQGKKQERSSKPGKDYKSAHTRERAWPLTHGPFVSAPQPAPKQQREGIKGKGDTGHLCWYIAAATTRGGRLDMTQVFSIPMCATGLEG